MGLSEEVSKRESALDYHPRPNVPPFQNETQLLQYKVQRL